MALGGQPAPAMNRWRVAGAAAVLLFAVLVARFWHPVYGFTRFLQLDAANESTEIGAFRTQPIYVYRNTGGYDGQYYAQIAYHPLLNAPELKTAVDNLNYRARRILPAALAWIIGGGHPGQIARVYAWLNLAAWLALAGLSWRVIEVQSGKGFAAWLGILFSAGALTSVRFALTDLIAATLTLAALTRGRATLALAALSRETALLALPGLWTRPWLSRKNGFVTLVAALPLALWLAYIQWRLGPGDAGFSNFTWPLQGWAEKGVSSVRALNGPIDFALAFSTFLAVAGLTVQAAYCLFRPRLSDPWWRVAAAYTVLLAFLGQAVWEGFPGATFRAVLPLTLACNLLMTRHRASWPWLIGGNLGVVAGLVALWQVPVDPAELGAARAHGQSVLVWEASGWYGAEHTARHRWAWASGPATLRIEGWPRGVSAAHFQLEFRSTQPQRVTVRQGSAVRWTGDIGPNKTTAEWDVRLADGRATLALQPDRPAVPESADAHARALAFAVYDLKVTPVDAPSSSP